MGDRVVDCARLESVCTARYRGFESPPIRHQPRKWLEIQRVPHRLTSPTRYWLSSKAVVGRSTQQLGKDG